MNGLPEDISLEFFVGSKLNQVCAGEYEIILHFDRPATLFLACDIAIDGGDRVIACAESAPFLLRFLGKRVSHVARIGAGDIKLTFETSGTLSVYDSLPNFESYHITLADQVIVV